MSWVILVISGVLEAVWATAMGKSEGFSRLSPSIVFAVTKLDAVSDPAQAYAAVRDALLGFAEHAGIRVAGIVPVSALRGDNVTQPLDAAWYDGPSLLQLLESLPTAQERKDGDLLVPVQYVAREGEGDLGGRERRALQQERRLGGGRPGGHGGRQ